MILSGKLINPGDLRTAITLKKRAVASDAGGFQGQTWTDIAEVQCRWRNVYGYEVWKAGMAEARQRSRVLIRYRDDIDLTCAVVKGSQHYEITSIDDIQDRHEYIELEVVLVEVG